LQNTRGRHMPLITARRQQPRAGAPAEQT
jgi:hypothetical protein